MKHFCGAQFKANAMSTIHNIKADAIFKEYSYINEYNNINKNGKPHLYVKLQIHYCYIHQTAKRMHTFHGIIIISSKISIPECSKFFHRYMVATMNNLTVILPDAL